MLTLFTIVLNGEPFIEHHLPVLRQLTIPWQWRIVEGVAAPTHCTSWCRQMPDRWHNDYVSIDGTHEYLTAVNGWRNEYGSVSVSFRRSPWDGKVAMVNRALEGVADGLGDGLAGSLPAGVVMQIDSDEVWQAWQLDLVHSLMLTQTVGTAARFGCRYWVGPRKVLTSTSGWARGDLEWLRAWRWGPGCRFERHEPPLLESFRNCVPLEVTRGMGLEFDHYAYAHESQVQWKQDYYGYTGAVDSWRRLQRTPGPVRMEEFFPWAVGATADDV